MADNSVKTLVICLKHYKVIKSNDAIFDGLSDQQKAKLWADLTSPYTIDAVSGELELETDQVPVLSPELHKALDLAIDACITAK
jgi:hypothetical protein